MYFQIAKDFSIMYPKYKSFSTSIWCDSMDFLDIELNKISVSNEMQNFIQTFPSDLQNFLYLLILTKKRNISYAATVDAFVKVIGENFTIEDVLERADNYTQPFICVLSTITNNQYIIVLNNKVIPLNNTNFKTFHDVFDTYVKMFFVWNLKYDKSLTYFFYLFEVIMFKIKKLNEAEFPPTMVAWVRKLVQILNE